MANIRKIHGLISLERKRENDNMYAKGHAGLTMTILSIVMLIFSYSTDNLIVIWMATALSVLPDIDLKWQRQGVSIKHRGKATHSLLFAIITGLIFAGLFWYSNRTLLWVGIGFFSGFLGVATHLIGDVFTYHKFMPLWPLSEREFGYGLTRASNPEVNNFLAEVGVGSFVLYILLGQGVLVQLLEIF